MLHIFTQSEMPLERTMVAFRSHPSPEPPKHPAKCLLMDLEYSLNQITSQCVGHIDFLNTINANLLSSRVDTNHEQGVLGHRDDRRCYFWDYALGSCTPHLVEYVDIVGTLYEPPLCGLNEKTASAHGLIGTRQVGEVFKLRLPGAGVVGVDRWVWFVPGWFGFDAVGRVLDSVWRDVHLDTSWDSTSWCAKKLPKYLKTRAKAVAEEIYYISWVYPMRQYFGSRWKGMRAVHLDLANVASIHVGIDGEGCSLLIRMQLRSVNTFI